MNVGSDDDHYWFDIVGESSYQGTLRLIDGGRLERQEDVYIDCLIATEPNNPHDPNAVAVFAEGHAKVGYFSRDDVLGRCKPLRDLLVRESAIGTCRGKLTGGWDEEVSIGVRLALVRPSRFAHDASSASESTEPKGLEAPTDWQSRQRISLPIGKAWMNLVEERHCQQELRRLAEDRNVANESVAFEAVLIPTEGGVIVCAGDGGPVGRMGRSDVERYAELFALLEVSRSIGVCGGWVIREGDALGARITMKSPKALIKDLVP